MMTKSMALLGTSLVGSMLGLTMPAHAQDAEIGRAHVRAKPRNSGEGDHPIIVAAKRAAVSAGFYTHSTVISVSSCRRQMGHVDVVGDVIRKKDRRKHRRGRVYDDKIYGAARNEPRGLHARHDHAGPRSRCCNTSDGRTGHSGDGAPAGRKPANDANSRDCAG